MAFHVLFAPVDFFSPSVYFFEDKEGSKIFHFTLSVKQRETGYIRAYGVDIPIYYIIILDHILVGCIEIVKVYGFSSQHLHQLIQKPKLPHDGILKTIVFAHMGFHAFYSNHIQCRFVNHPRRPIKGENLNRIWEALMTLANSSCSSKRD